MQTGLGPRRTDQKYGPDSTRALAGKLPVTRHNTPQHTRYNIIRSTTRCNIRGTEHRLIRDADARTSSCGTSRVRCVPRVRCHARDAGRLPAHGLPLVLEAMDWPTDRPAAGSDTMHRPNVLLPRVRVGCAQAGTRAYQRISAQPVADHAGDIRRVHSNQHGSDARSASLGAAMSRVQRPGDA